MEGKVTSSRVSNRIVRLVASNRVMQYIIHHEYGRFRSIQETDHVAITWSKTDAILLFCLTKKLYDDAHKQLMMAVNKFMDFYNEISVNLVDATIDIPTEATDLSAHYAAVSQMHDIGEKVSIKDLNSHIKITGRRGDVYSAVRQFSFLEKHGAILPWEPQTKRAPQKKDILTSDERKMGCIRTKTGVLISIGNDQAEAIVAELNPIDEAKQLPSQTVSNLINLHYSLYGPIKETKVVVTPGFENDKKYIVYVSTPKWLPFDKSKYNRLMLQTYRNIFKVVSYELKLTSVSLPVLYLTRQNTHQQVELLYQSLVSFLKSSSNQLNRINLLCENKDLKTLLVDSILKRLKKLSFDKRFITQEQNIKRLTSTNIEIIDA